MKALLILFLLIITACTEQPTKSGVEGLKCSESQLKSATDQFNLCLRSEYFSSHCLQTSMKAHCDKVKE